MPRAPSGKEKNTCPRGGLYNDPEAIFLAAPYCDLAKEVYNF